MGTRAEDVVEHLIIASTHAYLLIFTNKGRVFWLKIYNIPDAGTTGKGKHASGLMNLQPEEVVTAFLPVKEFVAGKFIVMVTKQGVIKKCELTEFDNPMARGIIALGLDEGDELLAARLTTGSDYIFLGSHEGMACRFNEEDVRADGPAGARRSRHGSRRGRLPGGRGSRRQRRLDSFDLRERLRQAYAAGTDYRLTARGRKGVINMKTTPRIGKVVGILSVKEDSELMIITKQGQIIRIDSSEIRQAGRSTQGVRLVNVEEGDQVAAASLIPDAPEGGTNGQSDLPLQ